MFRPFGFLAPKDLYIIWFLDSLVSSVPDEGYSRNSSFVLNLISSLFVIYICISSQFYFNNLINIKYKKEIGSYL